MYSPALHGGRSGVVRRYDPDKLVRDVGRRVAEIRREKGLTQQALATKLKATMQWVQQIEYGANLTLFSLARLANALDLPLELFLVAPQGGEIARRGRPPKQVAGRDHPARSVAAESGLPRGRAPRKARQAAVSVDAPRRPKARPK
jgi:transcriptional regulator with XRE-family HTH domain